MTVGKNPFYIAKIYPLKKYKFIKIGNFPVLLSKITYYLVKTKR